MIFRADLHIHSCLSPCASLEMSPRAIARQARAAGLNAVALADHNSALNTPALQAACRREGLFCFQGLEAATLEEVHVLCLFDDLSAALELGRELLARLPDVHNLPEKFGDQAVVNEHDEVEQLVERYLGNATDIPFAELKERVQALGGLFIPAHVDKPVFSVTSQLGFLPPGDYPALEATRFQYRRVLEEQGGGLPVICNSDAHNVEDIGVVYNEWEAEEWSLDSFRDALKRRAVTVRLRPLP